MDNTVQTFSSLVRKVWTTIRLFTTPLVVVLGTKMDNLVLGWKLEILFWLLFAERFSEGTQKIWGH